MPNIQQPEMRRSGQDPLVQDSSQNRAAAPGRPRGRTGAVPDDQRSPYGPRPSKERMPEGSADEEESQR